MKAIFVALVVLVACATARVTNNANIKYSGAQVFRVFPENKSQLLYLSGLHRSDKYDFWTTPRTLGKPVDIMALRWDVQVLKETLKHTGMKFDVMISDVYQLILKNQHLNDIALERARQQGKAMEWTAYHDYDEIMLWLDSLAEDYPGLVTVEDVGLSYEGRTMKLVTVSTGGGGTKPSIFVDAGIHAREWIAPATATYILNDLLENSGTTYAASLAAVDLYFMISINPDGYAYSWTDDRLWRKTRSPTDSTLGCYGVDPNRNWDFHWMESGASSNGCSDTYAGPVPFSEVECQIVRDQMLKFASTSKVYLTYHSYGQDVLYGWGYDAVRVDDWEELAALGEDSIAALAAVYGTQYVVACSGIDLYPAAGASDDYAKGIAGIKYSYTVELRDTGTFGFQLPPGQITPTGIETLASFVVILDFVSVEYGTK